MARTDHPDPLRAAQERLIRRCVSESWLIERTSDGRGWRLVHHGDRKEIGYEIFGTKRLAIDHAVTRAARLKLHVAATVVSDDRVVLEVEPMPRSR
jgi:hypothetical protein